MALFTDWMQELAHTAAKDFGFAPEAIATFDSREGWGGQWWAFWNEGYTPFNALFEALCNGEV
ncbi:hypothetical protein JCM16814_34510 [Desulfobaculum senezii]|jgi:hypothetical protein|uniref:hypothetical protein n=1 Tax=Desulfobaculum sp. SPO524 TaxID=3378071 RepID=UPI003852B879